MSRRHALRRLCLLCGGARLTMVRVLDAPNCWLCADCGTVATATPDEQLAHDAHLKATQAEQRQRARDALDAFGDWAMRKRQQRDAHDGHDEHDLHHEGSDA